jgi:hypothetical protein
VPSKLLLPTPVPYDPVAWSKLPLPARARAVCEAWALQGYGAPIAGYALYVVKIAFYVGVWVLCCGFSPALGGLGAIETWWLSPIAFQKAILWSMLFEGLGLGCGSGPLSGRYHPPIGGVLYFARVGTIKLPLWPKLPLVGGTTRTWFDVALYLALVGLLGHALVAAEPARASMMAIAAVVVVIGVADRTIFLALRGEHYWTTIACFAIAPGLAGAKAVQLALWFWAGFSKLNHHFPAVVCVMVSNSPFTRFGWLRRAMYRSCPTASEIRNGEAVPEWGNPG